eukprot:gene13505-28649_t
MTGSNRRPPACKAGALPAELIPRCLTLGTFEHLSSEGLVGLPVTNDQASAKPSATTLPTTDKRTIANGHRPWQGLIFTEDYQVLVTLAPNLRRTQCEYLKTNAPPPLPHRYVAFWHDQSRFAVFSAGTGATLWNTHVPDQSRRQGPSGDPTSYIATGAAGQASSKRWEDNMPGIIDSPKRTSL